MTQETTALDITYALAASPNFAQDGICFAGRASGLYRSDDGGHTWRLTYKSLRPEAPLATLAVAVSPNFASDQSVFAGAAGGILRSFDAGQSWYITTLPDPPPLVLTLVTSPNYTNDSTLLAGTVEDGVFRSVDRGRSWFAWNFGLLDRNILCLAISPNFAHDQTVWVGTETGIFRSANGGRAWREVDFPTEFAPVLSLALSPGYADDGILFAGTETSGLFYSEDHGLFWKRLAEEAIAEPVNSIILSPEFPVKPELLVLLSDRLLISRDGGQSWSAWPKELTLEQNATTVLAPQGLAADAPLLVGLVEGEILRI